MLTSIEPLTLPRVREAVLFSVEANKDCLSCEKRFAESVRLSSRIIEARFQRSQAVYKKLKVDDGCILVDMGSGIALSSVLILMCGAGEVYAVEREDKRFKQAESIIKFLELEDRIHLIKADLLDFSLPEASMDGAYSSELLEHIADLPRLYRRIGTWLKPGKRVHARTGANGRSLFKKWFFFRKAWDRCDKGYLDQRREMIQARAPHLGSGQILTLAGRTRGLLAQEIDQEVDRYILSGRYPPDRRPCTPRDPITGEFMERNLDAFETARQIDREGFTTRVLRPDLSSLTTINPVRRQAYWVLGKAIAATHPLSLCVAPWLEFLSTRDS